MKLLTIFILITFSISSFALEKSPSSKIKRLISYSKYGNGDIYVQLESSGSICSYGYYVNENSAGYKNNFSMLLAAYQAKTSVVVEAYEQNRWAGSSNPVCEIYSVTYQ